MDIISLNHNLYKDKTTVVLQLHTVKQLLRTRKVVENYASTTEVLRLVDSDGLDSVNVRIPDELLRIIDSLVTKGIFSSRAEAIREFLREYTLESKVTSEHSTFNSTSNPTANPTSNSKFNSTLKHSGGRNE